jgi:glucose/arabinose dehydrogenase
MTPGVFTVVSSASSPEEDPDLTDNVAASRIVVPGPGAPARDDLAPLSAVDTTSARLGANAADLAAVVTHPTQPEVQLAVERGGRIRVLVDGAPREPDYLDLRGQVRELLNVAFAPDYASSGRVFVSFIDTQGASVVSRFRSSGNPLAADVQTRRDLQWPDGSRSFPPSATLSKNGQPLVQPVVGDLQFGPDGYLYIGVGNRGADGDPEQHAQNPSSPIGKMLRVDVRVADSDAEGYDVPTDNPFVGQPGVWPEIWAFGLRNPARFSIDAVSRGGTNAIVIADVGSTSPGGTQEVNAADGGGRGLNYGWPSRSGFREYDPTRQPAFLPLANPVFERIARTSVPESPLACEAADSEIVGGIVYRGAALGAGYAGRYFFATAGGALFSLRLLADPSTGSYTAADLRNHTLEISDSRVNRGSVGPGQACSPLGRIRSFTVDADGELSLVGANGIYRLVPGGCAGPNPFADLPGMWGVCINGGWLPSGHPLTRLGRGTGFRPPAPPAGPAPAQGSNSCATPDPFISIPGMWGVCVNSGWVPSGHPLAVGGTPVPSPTAPAGPSGSCTTPDPFVAIPGLHGVCIAGGWVPTGHPLAGGR